MGQRLTQIATRTGDNGTTGLGDNTRFSKDSFWTRHRALILVDTIPLYVSASMGVTIYPQDGVDAEQLLRHADQTMYLAKQDGKNRFHMFDMVQCFRRYRFDQVKLASAAATCLSPRSGDGRWRLSLLKSCP